MEKFELVFSGLIVELLVVSDVDDNDDPPGVVVIDDNDRVSGAALLFTYFIKIT